MLRRSLYYITHWESWHWFAKYILIAPAWAWFCLRARTLWFFTPSNPTITFGGFAGETKREVYQQLPEGTWPKSIFISPGMSLTEIVRQMDDQGLNFPVVAKPDSGLMGFMFRKIDSIDHLRQYHEVMDVEYIVQEFIDFPLEISVFYYRFPDHAKGTITGFLRKEFLEVTGDGNSTLLELILHYPRVQFRLEEMKGKHASRLNDIIPAGQRYCLSYALNLSRGGKLISLANEKDDRLLSVFDAISHYAKLYYGRYDIRCQSIEDLKEGKNYSILEFNGCGAEPHHVYGDGNTLLKACSILVQHWHMLFLISRYNHRHGIHYWPHKKGLVFYREVKTHMEKLKQLDRVFEFDAVASDRVYKQVSDDYASAVLTKREARMTEIEEKDIIQSFLAHLEDKLFPCLAAHTALAKNHIKIKVAGHMGCPHQDHDIVSFIYNFVDEFRNATDDFYSAVVLFPGTHITDEEMFDKYFWQRLQAFADLDAKNYAYDPRVDPDVHSPNFSFSLKEEAFYIIGGHPLSSRLARRFPVPGMVFNAHTQFEKLREENHYNKMQQVVRKRDVVYSGSVNPMLADFGEASEVFQYSGRQYDKDWKCPLNIHHARPSNHTSP